MIQIKKLDPHPVGWYCVGFSSDLPRGGVILRKFMGREIVLFRTESGRARAFDPHCPHLGAHLGHGGEVHGETIRCPFHHFCFDGEGTCVSTPYGTKPPPLAKVRAWPLDEVNDLLMVFFHPEGAEPDWRIPEHENAGWTRLRTKVIPLRSHPQETTENSVDIGHFGAVHRYTDVSTLKPLRTEGPYLNAQYRMHRAGGALGSGGKIRADFEIHAHGLGYSFVEVEVAKMGIYSRQYVLATPTEEGRIDLRIALRLRRIERPWRVNPGMALMPSSLATAIILRASFAGFAHDVAQDFMMWENKVHVQPPALAEGDGPIGAYRAWAKQFYANNGAEARATA